MRFLFIACLSLPALAAEPEPGEESEPRPEVTAPPVADFLGLPDDEAPVVLADLAPADEAPEYLGLPEDLTG